MCDKKGCSGGLAFTQTDNSDCLVEAAREDRTVFAQLFRRHYDEIFRYCARRLPCRQTAEDVTSTVFLKMIDCFCTFRGDDDAFRVWLYRIAGNEVNSYFRKAGRQARLLDALGNLPSPTPESDPGREDDNHIQIARLHRAMAQLKPAYREIVALRYLQGFNSEEIGKITGLKSVTVRSKLARALRLLKKEFRRDRMMCGSDEPYDTI